MNWHRTSWMLLAVLLVPLAVVAQEREKIKSKNKGPRTATRSAGGGIEFSAAKVTDIAQGKISFESDGMDYTFPVALSTKFYDDKGKEHDPVTGSIRFLAPGNVVAIRTKPGGKGEPRRVIAEVRFVSGKIGELPSAALDLADLKPDPKEAGSVIESKLREKDWNVYYARAKVGDFVLYRRGGEPGRREIVEVGEDYVIEAKVFYVLGTRDENWIKYKRFVDPSASATKTGTREPDKTANGSATKARTVPSKSRSKLTPAQQTRNKRSQPKAERPTSETITVAGRELACTIRRTAGDFEEWICDEVPFDGKVKDNSRSAYTLLDFGRGK